MKLFNTLSNQIEELNLTTGKIKMYLCGVTVYDECHIGHARTIIVFDVFRRFLESMNIDVTFIQNFTDVDDKIIARASGENISAEEISKRYINNYYRDFDALNVLRATEYPLVTDNINEITDFVERLLNKKLAYVGLNGVYYRVKSFPGYGKLSKKDIDQMVAGARIEVDETKDDPRDFALWKFSSSKPTWSSPWGNGRPGWHIECSAMALKYLGHHIDVHGGGKDLIFPHHENEIAQSEGLFDSDFARSWMHVGMVTIQSEKMSKSIGNTIKITELMKTVGPNVIRLFCISSHYSKPIDYSENIILEMKSKWRQITNAYFELEYRIRNNIFAHEISAGSSEDIDENKNLYEEFKRHLEDDLNFSGAFNAFFKFVNSINNILSLHDIMDESVLTNSFQILKSFMVIMGLKTQEVSNEDRLIIEGLIEMRNKFRIDKKYKESDALRDELGIKYGVDLIDHKNFTLWKKRSIDDI